MTKKNRTGKRLRLAPLILGGYGAFLGFGLAAIGLTGIKEGIGIIRLLIGLGMAGFGLLGIWDGVRDLVKPDKKPEQAPASQFILTDMSGNRSSNVTVEAFQKQMESLMESSTGGVFQLQILPPFAVQEIGNISRIFCMYHETFRLTAFMEVSEGGYESYHKSADFDEVKDLFEKLLVGSADFSGWKKMENAPPWAEDDDEDENDEEEDTGWEAGSICTGETENDKWEAGSICTDETEDGKWDVGNICTDETENGKWDVGSICTDETENGKWEAGSICSGETDASLEDTDEPAEPEPVAGFGNPDPLSDTEESDAGKSETDTRQTEERIKSYWHQLQREQKGQMRGWHQYLVIFGESWRDEHKFFSARDVELAIEGIHEGKYTKVVLEWGPKAFDLFPGIQNDLMVIWCTNNTGRGETRFLAREGTVTQVKFWLVGYLDKGCFEEMSGWADITAQIEKIASRAEKENRKGEKKNGKVF